MNAPPSVLERIFAYKREEVAEAKRRLAPEALAALADAAPPTRGFRRALVGSPHRPSLIAEVKAASPSQGPIRAGLDPAAVARAYRDAGAEALSVLTDAPSFGGSPENLKAVRAAVELPILRKDFLFDPYQVDEARAWGADAVLLIAAMLEPGEIARLLACAKARALDVLLEVHAEEELDRTLPLLRDAGHALLGVNNRNLHDFAVDLATTERLKALYDGPLVSESGLATPEDVARAAAYGARTVLIGTAFCAEADVAAAVRRVMARPAATGDPPS